MGRIESLGLEKKIVKDKEEGLSIREIAEKHNLSKSAVSRFLSSPNAIHRLQRPIEKQSEKKIQAVGNSIFDINAKLERSHLVLTELKKDHDTFYQVFCRLAEKGFEVKGRGKFVWFKEYRKQIELSAKLGKRIDEQIKIAADLIKSLAEYERSEQFRKILVEEIGKESKDVRDRIVRRMHNTRFLLGKRQ